MHHLLFLFLASLGLLLPNNFALSSSDIPPGSPAIGTSPTSKLDPVYAKVEGKQLGLDLFLPGSAKPIPLVILIHGGGWGAGTKRDFDGLAPLFNQHGYAIASLDYRLTNQAIFPAQIQDVKAAVRWLRANARQYNLDPDHFAAMGHSAGAHLAALLGTSGDIVKFEMGDDLNISSKVQAVVDLAGPVDLVSYFTPKNGGPGGPVALFGGNIVEEKDLAALASPVDHIGPGTPPFLIMSGTKDDAVGDIQPKLIFQALCKAGVPAQILLIPGVPHGIDLNLPYGNGKLIDAVFNFLDPLMGKTSNGGVPAQ